MRTARYLTLALFLTALSSGLVSAREKAESAWENYLATPSPYAQVQLVGIEDYNEDDPIFDPYARRLEWDREPMVVIDPEIDKAPRESRSRMVIPFGLPNPYSSPLENNPAGRQLKK
ncbi:hypothetical protein K8I28_04305 [bacterium]|nr:hypothetical protein [bacterium]